jgi:MraZ protein
MLLTGAFPRTLDEKLRFAIPKALRAAFGDAPKVFYLTPGTDGSLAIYTEPALADLAGRLAAASPTRRDVRDFSRLFYAQTQAVELDAQGRVRIPPELARWAGLQKEVVLLGLSDHLELWDQERWASYLAARQGGYDELAEQALAQPQSPSEPGPSRK